MTGDGRVWRKPLLIVIERANAQESVLSSCRSMTVAGDPESAFTSCAIPNTPDSGSQCGWACDSLARS